MESIRWPILRGWTAIEESWRRIFAGPGRNQFIVTNEALATIGDTAWITLDENLVDRFATGTTFAEFQRGNIRRTLTKLKTVLETAGTTSR